MTTAQTHMTPEDMDHLIDRHLMAEMAGDSEAAVAVYTKDVEHDVVGSPQGQVSGPERAKVFYDRLIADVDISAMEVVRRYFGDNFCVYEHLATGDVVGAFLGIPGHGKTITFRVLHVWEFRDNLISRENVWIDGGSVAAQLTR